MTVRLLKKDIKRLALKKTTWFALLLFILITGVNLKFIHSELPTSNPYYDPLSAFEYFVSIQGGGSGFLLLLLPLGVTLTTGDFFIRERLSSILSYSLIRADNIKVYIRNRIISLGITSFLFIFFLQLILFIGTLVLFPVTKPKLDQGIVYYAVDLFINSPLIYSFIVIINSALMAFFFSCISVLISLYSNNLYTAIMLPYVIFIGVSEILMSFPMFLGIKGILFYNISPLNMAGDYITNSFHWAIVPLYWIILSIICIKIIIIMFMNRFQKEKLLIN